MSSRQYTEATNGTAHFLEHMAFKGTKVSESAWLSREVKSANSKHCVHRNIQSQQASLPVVHHIAPESSALYMFLVPHVA